MKCSGTNQVCLEKNKFYPAVDTTAYVKVMHNERLQIITKIWFLPFKVFLTQSTINWGVVSGAKGAAAGWDSWRDTLSDLSTRCTP